MRANTFNDNVSVAASAIRRLATAASDLLGRDCYVHAAITQALLADLGLRVRLVAGFAAWRIGSGSGAVVIHAPVTRQAVPPPPDALHYHAWLEYRDKIIDVTTYQLPRKIAELDAMDGQETVIDWVPDVLVMPASRTRTLNDVVNGMRSGICYYRRNIDIENRLSGFELDDVDLANARFLMEHPEAIAIGPANLETLSC